MKPSGDRQPMSVILVVFAGLLLLRLFFATGPVSNLFTSILEPIAQVTSWLDLSDEPDVGSQSPELAQLQNENQSLREALELPDSQSVETVSAEVIGKNVQSFRRTFRIASGSNDQVKEGSPVLYAGQLIGSVYRVEDSTALVTLIGDGDFRAAAVVGQTQSEGIFTSDAGSLVLDKVNRNGVDLLGQSVFTSGVGGLFPPGLFLGEISTELSDQEEVFARYGIDRSIDYSGIDFVEVGL